MKTTATLLGLLTAVGILAFITRRFLIVGGTSSPARRLSPTQEKVSLLIGAAFVNTGLAIVGLMLYVFYFE